MRQGDLVARKSYGEDLVFRIQQINAQKALLKGVEYRLMADAPMDDLTAVIDPENPPGNTDVRAKAAEAFQRIAAFRQSRQRDAFTYDYFEVPGKVLHLDGDPLYLNKSMQLYKQLRVPAEGFFVPESNMGEALRHLLPQTKPDILVITGHDGIIKDRHAIDLLSLQSYKNSHHFVRAVQIAREYERDRDSLIIIAGACQSFFEALLQAGANFASSPARILIHALDPLYIAAKVSFTSIKDTIQIADILHHTMSGIEGLGGMETRGSYRKGLPSLNFL